MDLDRPPQVNEKAEAIIFDIGRVIVGLDPQRALTHLGAAAGGGRDARQLWCAVESDPRWNDWQEGRMGSREWHAHLTRALNVTIGYADFCAAWNSILLPEPILNENLFRQLSERYRLAVLSNTDPLHSAVLDSEFSFLRHFPVRIYSCRVGVSKPSPAIFRAALDALGVTAASAIYIDDIEGFVGAANALGLDAIRFESPAQLASEFSRRGLRLDGAGGA
jgi:FMN phosphatase YigB (HAD superfamily)